jgi:undecaprenyl diphosphate synthase
MNLEPGLVLPDHVGIILDGNGRWALSRGLPRTRGHEVGSIAVRKAVESILAREIKNLTLYAFSAQSWSRPKEEIDTLMRVVQSFADEQRASYAEQGIRVIAVGDLDELPTPTRRAVERMVEATARA